MSFKKFMAACGLVFLAAGCGTIAEKTNMLTDEKIKSSAGGALGISPDELTITNRRVDGTNTYVDLKNKRGKEFSCIINGGNLLSGMLVNPPSCGNKGEPLRATGPFGR